MANVLTTSPLKYDSTTTLGNGLGRPIHVKRIVLVAAAAAASATFSDYSSAAAVLQVITAPANTAVEVTIDKTWDDFNLSAISGAGAVVFVHFNN